MKTLIRLGGCPGWSDSSLGTHSLCWFCHVAAHITLASFLCQFMMPSFLGHTCPQKNLFGNRRKICSERLLHTFYLIKAFLRWTVSVKQLLKIQEKFLSINSNLAVVCIPHFSELVPMSLAIFLWKALEKNQIWRSLFSMCHPKFCFILFFLICLFCFSTILY